MPHEILVGVSGGVAAYKTAALVSLLVQKGHGVSVVMTESAREFIGAATFEALTGRPVISAMFTSTHPLGPHIELADRADVFCIAPATANLLAKAACGIADDLVTTLMLSFGGPTLVAPAMNCRMWEKRAVQRNVATLNDDGVHVIDPEEGWLSCRERGFGRMASPERIAESIHQTLAGIQDST